MEHYRKQGAPEITITEYEKDIARLGLRDIVEIALVKENGSWLTIIKRDGYRVIAEKQDDYRGMWVIPLYEGDTYSIVKGELSVNAQIQGRVELGDDWVKGTINQMQRGLVGAVGCIKREGRMTVFRRVSLGDYLKIDSKYQELPEAMIVGACEVKLIKAAYPNLFSGIYHENEILKSERDEKASLFAIIDANMGMKEVSDMMLRYNKRRDFFTVSELKEVCLEIEQLKKEN